MTDTYAEDLLVTHFLKLEGLNEEAVYEAATEYEEGTSYYVLNEESYIEADPQPTSQEELDQGEYFIISDYPTVAFPNEVFTKPDDGYWYELYFIPAEPLQIELGTEARSRWTGILQINICVPKDSGTKPINERYNNIEKLYRRGLILDGLRIMRTYRTSAYDDGDYYVMPVTVEWQADLDR